MNQKVIVKKPLKYYIGNLLILTAIFILTYIYYPIVSLYIAPPIVQGISTPGEFSISIPRINAFAPIIENVDPWDKEIYREELKKGVAHAKGSSLPGEGGRVFLFAHSSDYPWNLTRYNTVFFRLGELNIGDKIFIYKDDKSYSYMVSKKVEVWPNDVSYLNKSDRDELILQTCTPPGTDLKRLLIFTLPVSVSK